MTISVIIPTYNSAGHIASTISEIARLEGEHRVDEVVVVDDCSTDDTVAVLHGIAAVSHGLKVRVVCLRRNMGQATATAVGLATASGDVLVTMDDDLQHNPDDVAALVQALGGGVFDFVVGCFPSTRVSLLRRLGSAFVHGVARRTYATPRSFSFSSFCAYTREFVRAANLLERRTVDLGWMFAASGRYRNVEVGHASGIRGHSTYSLRTLVRTARPFLVEVFLWLTRPLMVVALASVVAALGLAGYYAYMYFARQESIPGFATLAILGLVNIALVSVVLVLSVSAYRRLLRVGNVTVGSSVVASSVDPL